MAANKVVPGMIPITVLNTKTSEDILSNPANQTKKITLTMSKDKITVTVALNLIA
jgi:hypothetical protein